MDEEQIRELLFKNRRDGDKWIGKRIKNKYIVK